MNTRHTPRFHMPAPHGFTLMEVMVAVSIFAIVVTVGIVSLLTINDTYRKSQTERQTLDSLTFVLESMSRRIRTAASWDSATTYGSPSNAFTFIDQDGVTITYQWSPSDQKIYMDYECNGCTNPTLADGLHDMTPANVKITDTNADGTPFPGGGLVFVPTKQDGTGQSYVQINLGGYVANGKQNSGFSFQTGVSKRPLD